MHNIYKMRSPGKDKKRIGIFVDYIEQVYQSSVIRSCLNHLDELGHDAVVFGGGEMAKKETFYTEGSFIFNLAHSDFDGIIVLGGTFTSHVDEAQTLEFFNQFAPTPMVSISAPYPQLPCVIVNNYAGMKRLMRHLIVDHGYTKIGFQKKKDGQFEGEERFRAWKDCLEEYDLSADPNLVIPGTFYWTPAEAVRLLFESRHLKAGTDIEALVCADSYALTLLYPHLESRGIKIPEDLAVADFDYESDQKFPFRTTCETQPFMLIAEKAIETLLLKIEGREVPLVTEVSTRFIPGNSCGCADPLAIVKKIPTTTLNCFGSKTEEQFQADLKNLIDQLSLKGSFIDEVFHSYQEATNWSQGRFIHERQQRAESRYRDMGKLLHSFLPLSPKEALPKSFFQELSFKVQELWNETLTLQNQLAATHRDTDIKIRSTLSNVFEGSTPKDILVQLFQHLDHLGISRSFAVLYDANRKVTLQGRADDDTCEFFDDLPIPTSLTQTPAFGKTSHGSFTVLPLIAHHQPMGFIGLELPKAYWEDFLVFETIRQVVSGTLQNSRVLVEKERSLEELRKAREQLLVSEKMALLGGLVAGMAHEINTPIGNAVTAASFLKDLANQLFNQIKGQTLTKSELLQTSDNMKTASDMVLLNCQRAADLIQSFKHISVDQTSNQLREFNLAAYLDEIILSLRPQLKKTEVQVQINCPQDLTVQSYPGSFSQVISNLVMNSLIHGFKNQPDGNIFITAAMEGTDFLLLQYQDDGVGMSAESLSHLFEPFYTSMKNSGGSGLGTYTIYNIVTQKLKGSVHAESPQGKGLKYTFRLPLYGNT